MRLAILTSFLLTGLMVMGQFYIQPPKGQLVYVVDGVQIQDDAPVFEQEPSFPGGRFEMFRYLEANIPLTEPIRAEIMTGGEALVEFKLDAAGRIGDAAVLRTNTPTLEFVILRAVRNMPDWQPAIIDGVETAVTVYLPLGYLNGPGVLVFDQGTSKAIVGREPAAWWLKAILLAGAVGVFAGLFFGLR